MSSRGTPSRRRLAFLLPHLGIGGAQQGALRLASGLAQRGWDVQAVGIKAPLDGGGGAEDMRPRFRAAGVAVHDLGVPGRCDRDPRALMTAARRLRAHCRAAHIDVLDCAVLEADLVARVGLLGSRTRVVQHLVNTTYDEHVQLGARARAPWRPAAAKLIDAVTVRAADSLVAITETVADSAHRHLRVSRDRITVVPRGVDLDHFFPLARRSLRDPLRLLSVGRLVPQKNHAVLLEVVRELLSDGIRCTLTIVGEGPLRGALLEQRQTLQLEDAVAVLNPVPDVRPLLAEHDVFLFPSRWEGLGNALLEAMASGCLILASDLPVFSEVLSGAAALLPVDEPAAWAAAVRELANCSPGELAERRAAVRTRAEEAYDDDWASSTFAAHLERLLA